ncbi:TonB-dependent receptor [Sphingopyxis sp.]|uniref:TonB-dependent receptor n=1 Tax=Sphingopyxis sp. TaxID=1908224 RepID=UPI00262A8CE9|nr:TonB-dependent receptor [Sphingopyxis sp.]MCW0200095.1 TonB-dependent receptor [Sphingopyxis sp.]
MARFGTRTTLRALAGGVALAVLTQAAHAQEAPPADTETSDASTPGLGEIVVTAQKREENIQKTPIAITAVTSDRIAQGGLDQPQKLQFTVPSMNFSIASGFTYISLRGIGNNAASLTDSTVATYQDGVYTGMMLAQSVPTFDLQRIEVLRGPQGTLYGRNTTGGVINYISKDPDFEFGAAGDVSYGNYDAVEVNAGLTGPLVEDKIAVRASFHYDDHDGYYRNIAINRREYAGNSIGGRLAVLLRPAENLSITVRADMARSKTTDGYARVQTASLDGGLSDDAHPLGIFSQPASFFVANPGYLSPADIAKLNGGSIAQYYGLIEGGQYSPDNPAKSGTFANWYPTVYRTKASGVSLTANWDLGDVNVKSISAYRYGDLYNTGDIGGRFTPGAYVLPINETNKQYTQEFNVSGKAFGDRLDWLAGAFYYHMDGANYTATYLPAVAQYLQANVNLANAPGSPFAYNLNAPALAPLSSLPGTFPSVYQTASFTGPGFPGFQNIPADGPTTIGSTIPVAPFFGFAMTQKSDSYAGFVQATYHVTDALRVTGGFRYTIDRKVATRNVHSNFIYDLTAATIYQYVQGGILPPEAYTPEAIAAAANLCNAERTPKTWRAPTGMISVDYDAAEHVLTYAKASWGYKAGGMNNGECGTSYDPEYLASYEGGVKAVMADGQILTNLAFYYYDYKDIQFATYSNNTSHILNAASATAFGVELEYAIRPRFAEGWQLDGSASFQDSQYGAGCFGDPANTNNAGFLSTPKQACPATVINPNTGQEVPIGASANIKGNPLLRAPRWKTNFGLQYSTDVGGFGNIMARVDAAWTSKKYNAIWADKIPGTEKSADKPYWVVNAVLGWTSPDKRYAAELFGENITNSRYYDNLNLVNTPSTMYTVIGAMAAPRTYGVRFRAKFGSSAY